MGVMSCSRPNCENIMCDTYVDNIGYICTDCQSEFEDFLHKKGLTNISERQMKRELIIFMKTDKDTYIEGDVINVHEFFKKYTH